MLLQNLCSASWTNYVVDAVIVIILVLFVEVCAKRGFIDCFFRFVSTIGAFLGAIVLTKLFIEITGGLFGLQDVLTGTFESSFLKMEGFAIDISNEGLTAALAEKQLPSFLVNMLVENYGNPDVLPGTTLAFAAGQTLSRLAITLIAFLILFIALRLVLRLLRNILNGIAKKLTLIGAVNTLCGAAVGLVEGALVVCAILSLLSLVPSEVITTYISNSYIAGWLYNHNVLNLILGWIGL